MIERFSCWSWSLKMCIMQTEGDLDQWESSCLPFTRSMWTKTGPLPLKWNWTGGNSSPLVSFMEGALKIVERSPIYLPSPSPLPFPAWKQDWVFHFDPSFQTDRIGNRWRWRRNVSITSRAAYLFSECRLPNWRLKRDWFLDREWNCLVLWS